MVRFLLAEMAAKGRHPLVERDEVNLEMPN